MTAVKDIKFIYIIFLMLLMANHASAQSMSSPYSIYGIGDIEHRYYNMNAGMGYTGLALKTSLFGWGTNPASASGMEKSFFTLDANAAARTVTYHGNSITADNSNNNDFTIEKLSMTTKPTSFWATGIGFRQFSNVNYAFQDTKSIEGSASNYLINYSGDGGLNEYFWNNAFNIGKHLSVGVNTSFIAGPINQTETLTDVSGTTLQSTRRDYYANGRLEYGLIYSGNLSKNWTASIGGRFSDKTKMNYDRTLTITQNTTTTLENEFLKYSDFNLPRSYGAGIALTSKKGTTLAADYSFANWSALNLSGSGYQLVNSNRISAGAEFGSFGNNWNKSVIRKAFQFGAFWDNSYLMVNNHQISEYGLTAGLIRSLSNSLLVGISLEGGVRGTTQANLIRENYGQLTFTLSYRDFVYSKGHKYN
ncbi:MAG TPA: hypothetical protein VNS32_09010 [Flavisolibacter sp.]|nr:hypothetical protein [Flavisolibacter sp.]